MTAGRGRFISLEGGEGVGKTTQLAALGNALRHRGINLLTTREPGGSPGAEAIRQLLLSGDDSRWSPRAEALLFAAARADHVEKTIRPVLTAGRWVLADRFLDSSLAYQGGGAGLGTEAVRALHAFGTEDFLPERTLVLMLREQEGIGRADARDGGASDRIGARELTKEFKGFVAVSKVNLNVRRGSIHALIGPNGAGKTPILFRWVMVHEL